MQKRRDSRIEAYRCFLMFGIVSLHCAYTTIGSFTWENNIWKWCVDGFAFISGYCCIRQFSVKKVARLYLQAIFCLVLMECLNVLVAGVDFDWNGRIWKTFCDLWFLHAYVFLMVMAPLINLAAENEHRIAILLPFSSMVLLWGMCCELPIIGSVMPKISGIQSFSGLTLSVAYAWGRLYNVLGLNKKIKGWWVIVAIPILLVAFCLGVKHNEGWVSGWLGNYISPLAVVMAACAFYVFCRLNMPSSFERVVFVIAPSMFPVYVIHSHSLWWNWMKSKGAEWINDYPTFLALIGLAVIVFFGSVSCDFIRRSLVRLLARIPWIDSLSK